jgi:hypothetical protein
MERTDLVPIQLDENFAVRLGQLVAGLECKQLGFKPFAVSHSPVLIPVRTLLEQILFATTARDEV